ncbi:MAG: GNAT family N-acetyltransferase [Acidobacteria bacterium]|nr:GNAT family N-acetyltransferase [Acidobacteriota bacterium]
MSFALHKQLAQTLPDIPRWVETRSMLLSGRAQLFGLNEDDDRSYVVRSTESGLASVVGVPEKSVIKDALGLDKEIEAVLASVESLDHVSEALPDWTACPASLHLPGQDAVSLANTSKIVRLLSKDELEAVRILPHDLRDELTAASRYSPLAGVIVDGTPVSFCYAAAQTETLWDISIDTLQEYRNQGYGAAAVTFLIDHMKKLGKKPVWGAEDSNIPSLRLAARLGFVIVDKLLVFKRLGV